MEARRGLDKREEAIETRRKPGTEKIATAEVAGKNPDKLKKSIIADNPGPFAQNDGRLITRACTLRDRLSENARGIAREKKKKKNR